MAKDKVNEIKVGFLSEQNSGWMGGINYYKNLFIAMSKVDNPKLIPYIVLQKDKKAKLLLSYAKKIKFNKDLKYQISRIFAKLSNKKFSKERYFRENIEIDIVSHTQCQDHMPAIAWIPDFQHVHLPEMFSESEIEGRNRNFKALAEKSLKIIFSSQDAFDDFKNLFPEYVHKGEILHFVAISDEDVYKKTDEIKEEVIKKFNLPAKYFYVPNQFWVHKNHKVVFEAISILKKQNIDINVVFTGNTTDYRNSNHFDELMDFAKKQNIENNIKILGLVNLIDVYYLMRNCISIINPSLFEGWSSTVEEAKSIGKNIILSNLSVHKEQSPLGGVYFDPRNPDELANILKDKWTDGESKPDYELEKIAKEQLENRINEFGRTYQKIVLKSLQEIK